MRLATLSLLLGVFGLGPLALIAGLVAWRRDQLSRRRSLAGIVLGCIGTVAPMTLLAANLHRRDPLTEPLSRDRTAVFVDAAFSRIERVEAQVQVAEDRLGLGASEDMLPIHARLDRARAMLEELDAVESSESLGLLRSAILAELDSARLELSTR
jgi:hypothetical protein